MFTKSSINITKQSCLKNVECKKNVGQSVGWNAELSNENHSAVLSTGVQVLAKPLTETGWPSLMAWRGGGPGRVLSGVRASGVVDSLELGLRPVNKKQDANKQCPEM